MIYYNIFMKKCSLYFIIFIIIVIIALSGWFSINGDFEKEEASELGDRSSYRGNCRCRSDCVSIYFKREKDRRNRA